MLSSSLERTHSRHPSGWMRTQDTAGPLAGHSVSVVTSHGGSNGTCWLGLSSPLQRHVLLLTWSTALSPLQSSRVDLLLLLLNIY